MLTKPIPRQSATVAIFLIALFIQRMFYASGHELLQDEAYYWQWSRHLAPGYYDNTPLVAFVIRIFTTFLGNTQLGVRMGAIVCITIASIAIYVLANRLYGATTALFAVLVTNIVPICGAGAIIMTQDPVQIAFWSLSLVGAWWAVNSQNDQAALAWLTTGLLVGLTGMSKLNGLFMLPSIALFCAVSPDHRRWLTRWEPYAATVVACALMLPFLWWNHAHGNMFWVHLHAMSGRGTGHGFTVRWVGDYLGSQALFLSPLLFITLLVCLFKPIRSRETVAQDLFVWSCTSVTLIATVGLALRNKVEGNWGVTAFVGGSILIARAIVCSWSRSSARRWNITGLVLAAVLSLCILYPSVLYSLGIKMSPNKDRTMELYGWRQLANRVATEQSAVGGPNKSFVFGINYRMPSEMAFYLPGHPSTYSLFLHDRTNEYMFWADPNQLRGKNAILVNDSDGPDHLDDCKAVFDKVVVMPPLKIYRAPYLKTPVRTLQIFRCYGWHGYDWRKWRIGA